MENSVKIITLGRAKSLEDDSSEHLFILLYDNEWSDKFNGI